MTDSPSSAQAQEPAVEIIDFPGFSTVVVRHENTPMATLEQTMDSSFQALGTLMAQGVLVPTGPAFSRYDTAPSETITMEVGFPVEKPLAESVDVAGLTVIPSELPACTLAITKYRGSYDGLTQAWEEFIAAVVAQGYEPSMPYWEAYDTEPTPDMDPADLQTGLAIPVTRQS